MRRHTLATLALLGSVAFTACDHPGEVTITYQCKDCDVAWALPDTGFNLQPINGGAFLSATVPDRSAIACRMVSRDTSGLGFVLVKVGGETLYFETCTFRQDCDLIYIGTTNYSWFMRTFYPGASRLDQVEDLHFLIDDMRRRLPAE